MREKMQNHKSEQQDRSSWQNVISFLFRERKHKEHWPLDC